MKILITGPFGTIGSHVVARLLEGGHRLTCLDLDTPGNRAKAARLPAAVTVVYGDITDAALVATLVNGIDAVVHLAAIIPPMTDLRPALAEKVNVEGTRIVVDAIERVAPRARLVFASSVSVHGFSAGREPPCRVDAPYDGRDAYARHKIACETMLRASTIPWVILRIGACADPGDTDKGGDREAAMASMFSIAPDTRIEFVHPLDAARAIAAACTHAEVVGKILFLGSGASSQLTWRSFVSTFPRALGLGDFPAEWFGDEPFYTDWMDTAESERLLGFQRDGYPAYAAAIEERLRLAKVVLTPFRPLVRWGLRRAIVKARRERDAARASAAS